MNKALLAFWVLCFALFGCESIQVAGGSSEVGNPKSSIYSGSEKDTSQNQVTGIGFGASGPAIRIQIRKKDVKDSSLASFGFHDSAFISQEDSLNHVDHD